MVQRRTMREWFAYLDSDTRELAESEFMAQMLFHQREYARESRDLLRTLVGASEHTEGMVGAIDLFLATMAERSGLPYAASGEVRAALDRQRDEQRRLAAAAREGAPS